MSTSEHSRHARTQEKVTPRQERLIAELLIHPTMKAAAAAADVPFATARRWLADDTAFLRAYRGARRRQVEHASAMLQVATVAAVAALMRNINDPAPPALQVRAAQIVLERAQAAVETTDLLERIEALEAALAETQAQQTQAQQTQGRVRRIS